MLARQKQNNILKHDFSSKVLMRKDTYTIIKYSSFSFKRSVLRHR